MNYVFTQRKFKRVTDAVTKKTGLAFAPSGGGDLVSQVAEWSAVRRGLRFTLADKPGYYVEFRIAFEPAVEGVPSFSVDVGKHFSVEDTARQLVGFIGAFLAPCGVRAGSWDEPCASWDASEDKADG